MSDLDCDGWKAETQSAWADIKQIKEAKQKLEESLLSLIHQKDENIKQLEAENTELKSRIHNAYETYAGMEGFKPETAPEGYCLQLLDKIALELAGGIVEDE